MMEESLLLNENKEGGDRTMWGDLVGEVKKVGSIAMPMMVVCVAQYLLRAVSMSMAGHLGKISLSSTAIALSFTNVTGFSLLTGMAGALDTLCGQAYGAGQYRKLGIYTYTSITCLLLVCIPISLLWTLMGKILIYTGQDPEISHKAGEYAMWLIPSLFGFAILESLVRYLLTQSLILPMVFCSLTTLCLHVPLCWALVYKTGMGSNGAALAIGISYWVNVIFLGVYVKFSSALDNTRTSFSRDVLLTVGEFFRYAVPSAAMMCLEWWSYEILILLSGLLPNAKLETSVISICFSISSLHFYIAYSFGAAASNRVSNELGAENLRAARVVVWAIMSLGAAEVTIAAAIVFFCRRVLGKAFSNDEEVAIYVARIAPILSLTLIMDGFQAVLSGVTRGSGKQHTGAYINLGAFYLLGIPLGLVLGFVRDMRATGFWIGLTAGLVGQFIMLSLLTNFVGSPKQIVKARKTTSEDTASSIDGVNGSTRLGDELL